MTTGSAYGAALADRSRWLNAAATTNILEPPPASCRRQRSPARPATNANRHQPGSNNYPPATPKTVSRSPAKRKAHHVGARKKETAWESMMAARMWSSVGTRAHHR